MQGSYVVATEFLRSRPVATRRRALERAGTRLRNATVASSGSLCAFDLKSLNGYARKWLLWLVAYLPLARFVIPDFYLLSSNLTTTECLLKGRHVSSSVAGDAVQQMRDRRIEVQLSSACTRVASARPPRRRRQPLFAE
jgi:hypothetical protein